MAAEDTDAVDLSDKKLDKIPEEVFVKCDNIRILNLSGNYAIRLDHSLKFFGNVVKLVLNRCAFSNIPDVISELKKLEELDLSMNDLSRGLNAVLTRLGQLKKLHLSSCKLSSLPDWIGALEQLELLTLTDNDFSGGLNPAVGQLRRLQRLELRGCSLTSLPDSIGYLQQLESLTLISNDFSGGLNPALGRLGRLKELNLESCTLTTLPDAIGDLEQLEDLNVRDNDFSAGLHTALSRLLRLKKLNLSYCKLSCLPDWIGTFEQLEDLTVGGNDFSAGLHTAPSRLLRLRKLNLSNCKLSCLPEWIGTFEQLEDLNVWRNDFSAGLHTALSRLLRLKKLDLSYCKLSCLPEWIGTFEQLENLTLRYNDFSGGLNPALGRLGRVKELNLQSCMLTTLPDSIGDLEQLEDLDASFNDFSAGLHTSLSRLLRLKKLNLSNCKLSHFPNWIGDFEQLEILCFMGNDFSGGLNPALGRLQRLNALELSCCKLTTLPEWIGDLEQVQFLSLGIDLYKKPYLQIDYYKEINLIGFNFNQMNFLETLNEKKLNYIRSRSNDFSGGLNPALGKLQRLVYLILDGCKLTNLPDFVEHLKQLKILSLRNNKLGDYPKCTLKLKKLLCVDISNNLSVDGNRIKHLPVELAFTNLDELILRGNPITEPPEEIWSQGAASIKSFMRAVIPGGELMYADTINMIGDTGAGKSSVAQSMIAKSPKATLKADRTHVLQQCRLSMEEHSVIINDFGGHEVYHSVMPIFLPTNGLLILVYDMTGEHQEEKVKKWMLTSLAKSKQVRMIIVGTHADLLASEQCSALEERMQTFSNAVLQDAVREVNSHVNRLKCQAENVHVQNKLSYLQELHTILARAAAPVVTLSCCTTIDGLNRLRDVVAKSLRPPETLPVRWCRAMNDILNQNADCLLLRIEDVERICGAHFTEADDSNALVTVLRYLAKTSQIIWLENHPLLHEYIFHSPQKIIDACKSIIHHDNVAPSSLPYYETEFKDYNKGILQESLLLELLSVQSRSVELGKEQIAGQNRYPVSAQVIVEFLQHFNLISYVRKVDKGKQFIVPCKLTSTEPQELLHELEKRGNACFNRVSVRLSFIGSIIPLSLFETSLSSMLAVAGELSRYLVWPNVWKDGAIVSNNGVVFFTKRINDVIVLTAYSDTSESSPWTILHPILKRLNDYIMASWYGAPPTCSIVCPWCVRYGQHNEPAKEIEIDLPTLVAEERRNKERLTCQTCLKAIPHSLCFPTREAGSFITEEREIRKFFSNTAARPVAQRNFGGSLCAQEGQKNVRWSARATLTDSMLRCILDGVKLQQLHDNFQRNCSVLTTALTSDEVAHIVSELYSKDMVTPREKENVNLKTHTTTEAAEILIDIILKKNEKTRYCAFIEILHGKPLCRHDLVDALTSLDE